MSLVKESALPGHSIQQCCSTN